MIVAAWDEAASAWRAVGAAAIAGDASRLDAAIASSGHYAWLVADTVPAAPPLPGSGALVDGVARAVVPDPATIHITPQPKVVFYKPGVNSTVGAVLDSPLPSGTPLRARIVESYTFTSADEARPDPFVEDLVFYQRPGPTSTVSASFIVTPSLTFDPIDLQAGRDHRRARRAVGRRTRSPRSDRMAAPSARRRAKRSRFRRARSRPTSRSTSKR